MGYRAQNELAPIESLDLVLENYLCHLPQNLKKCRPCDKLKRGLLTYIKGGIVLLQNLWYDNPVEETEANRRAEICIKCPLNVFPDKGPFVAWSDAIALASVGDKKVARHEELGNCAGCTCCLKAKVWYRGPFDLTTTEQSLMRSVKNCWQLES